VLSYLQKGESSAKQIAVLQEKNCQLKNQLKHLQDQRMVDMTQETIHIEKYSEMEALLKLKDDNELFLNKSIMDAKEKMKGLVIELGHLKLFKTHAENQLKQMQHNERELSHSNDTLFKSNRQLKQQLEDLNL